MMVRKRKYVTWRSLKKGQEIFGYKKGHSTCGFCGVVEATNVAFVTVLKWGTDKEEIAAEDTPVVKASTTRKRSYKVNNEVVETE